MNIYPYAVTFITTGNKLKLNMYQHILFLISILFFSSCVKEAEKINYNNGSPTQITKLKTDPVEIDSTSNLTIYYPNYSVIDLICGEIPSKNDKNVILVCAAAYTVKCLDTFDHMNIIGNHISNGVFFNGASSQSYTGAFSFYDGKPHFAYNNWVKDFNKAQTDGCGFAQDMMIHNTQIVKSWRDYNSKNIFRALCLLNDRLAVIDSKGAIPFGKFIYELANLGVQEAIYLDMGNWKHSWYRDTEGNAIDIFPHPNKYATNWITFYR